MSCSSEVLEQLLNFTISEDPEDEKKRLMSLSKDEVIEELLAAKLVRLTHPCIPKSSPHFSTGMMLTNRPGSTHHHHRPIAGSRSSSRTEPILGSSTSKLTSFSE